ncbi:MAG: GMC family oxidoreductase [Polyangiaceae bacterium]|nr:GMC family oxidoreductase [Polyangiaceae bacterium]
MLKRLDRVLQSPYGLVNRGYLAGAGPRAAAGGARFLEWGGASVGEVYDAIVIGSGFGGAVAACRLAQAGLRVAVFERGRRYEPGGFPRDWANHSPWLWKSGGPYDVRALSEMMVIQGAGYGGGSLVYSNVHLRPPAEVFEQGWPVGYSRASLDPYYDLVAHMLDVQPVPEGAGGRPRKTERMRAAADQLGRGEQFFYPGLAVQFGDAQVAFKNKFGVEQRGCSYCGECNVGCPQGAKNTLDRNYLAVAEAKGAVVRTGREVLSIGLRPNPDGSAIVPRENAGYVVSFRDHERGGEGTAEARRVFVCAGAVNTTELLLRCRAQETLPELSPRLGEGYSGNGDFVGFAFDTAGDVEPSKGPVITSALLVDQGRDEERAWFLVEDGGYPAPLASLLLRLFDLQGRPNDGGVLSRRGLSRLLGKAARGSDGGAAGARSAVFLAMGRDRARGRIRLLPVTGEAFVDWDVRPDLPLYSAQERVCSDLAGALGGRVAFSALWQYLQQPVSVHNLGGCAMGSDATRGVTDAFGQVHNYPGLYVLDGSILPSATGVNPASTIAAVAERNIERAIRSFTEMPRWRADEWRGVRPGYDPLAAVIVPPGGTPEPATPALGLSFTETLKGSLSWDAVPAGVADARSPRRAGNEARRAEFTVTVTIANLERFLANASHAGSASGVVRVPGLTPPEGAPVEGGAFNLFVAGASPDERRLLYALPFTGANGTRYVLEGSKEVRDDVGRFDLWSDSTRLHTVVREAAAAGRVVAAGELRIGPWGVLRQLSTFRVHNARSPVQKVTALARFGEMFFGTLWELFSPTRALLSNVLRFTKGAAETA